MIEEIIDGIWEDMKSRNYLRILCDEEVLKKQWRIIIRKAIAESQQSSQAMLEETAVMER